MCLIVGVAFVLCQSFNIKFNYYIKCVIEIVACLIDQMRRKYCCMFIWWRCFCPSSVIWFQHQLLWYTLLYYRSWKHSHVNIMKCEISVTKLRCLHILGFYSTESWISLVNKLCLFTPRKTQCLAIERSFLYLFHLVKIKITKQF